MRVEDLESSRTQCPKESMVLPYKLGLDVTLNLRRHMEPEVSGRYECRGELLVILCSSTHKVNRTQLPYAFLASTALSLTLA